MNDPLPATPISPLRQRLIDDMNMRRFSPETQRNYIRDVGRFATFVGRSPATATAEDLRRFQVEQREAGVGLHVAGEREPEREAPGVISRRVRKQGQEELAPRRRDPVHLSGPASPGPGPSTGPHGRPLTAQGTRRGSEGNGRATLDRLDRTVRLQPGQCRVNGSERYVREQAELGPKPLPQLVPMLGAFLE